MIRSQLLKGIRVVDLSMGWAGPLAARNLADMGAEVLKVESCARFDWWRGWEPTQEWLDANEAERAIAFNMVNRNKLDVTLDLATDRGRKLLLDLVAVSDVVVENYSSGVLPKLNLQCEVLKQVNPELVMMSMPAFGSTGPWKEYRAYGSTTEQASGLPHLTGEGHWSPTMIHVALGDAVAGLNGAAALLTALRHRKRTGQGQIMDLSQSECLFPLAAHGIVEQSVTGKAPKRLGNRSSQFAPHGVYRCAGDDRWLAIQVQTDEQWSALATEIGLNDERFAMSHGRLANQAEIDRVISAWLADRECREAMHLLQARKVPAGVVSPASELTNDPHLKSRGHWRIIEREFVGHQPNPLAPYRLVGAPFDIERPAPTLGEHNREILGEILGLTDKEIARLAESGIIGNRPKMPVQ